MPKLLVVSGLKYHTYVQLGFGVKLFYFIS